MLLNGHRYWGGLLVWGLALTTVAAAAIAQTGTAPKKEDLQREFNNAYEKKDYPRAVDLGLKLAALDPKDFMSQYKLAAVYALNGDKANALKWFKGCADNGYTEIRTARIDPDFESIRHEEAFQDAIEIIRKNRRVAYEEFKARVAKKEPLVILPPNHDVATAAPLLIVLHDDGGTAEAIAEVFKEPAQSIGAILVAPRAVYSAKGGGYRWGKRYEGNYVVMEALAYANSRHNIEPRRRVLAGFSQGGTIAMVAAYRNSFDFQGVIAIAPQYDSLYAPSPNPMRSPVPKYYLMVGAKDEALEDSRKYADEYRAMSVDVELEVHEGLGHEFPKNLTAELQKALRFVLER